MHFTFQKMLINKMLKTLLNANEGFVGFVFPLGGRYIEVVKKYWLCQLPVPKDFWW